MSRLSPLQITAGVVKSDSPYSQKGRWIDCDKILFRKGRPEKWRGHEFHAGPVVGTPRNLKAWDDFSLNRWLAVGTDKKLDIVKFDGTILNITPYRATATLTNPFTTTNASAVVTVTDTAHTAAVGDGVNFDDATAVAGITIDGDYTVDSVVDADNYTIVHSAAANTGTTGGGTVTASYEVRPGSPNVVVGDGWGTGTWGRGTWGTPRTGLSTLTRYPRVWALELAGENLYAMPSNDHLFQWVPGNPTVHAAIVANSPSGLWMFLTNEGFPVVLGVDGDYMTIAWPDQNDHTVWSPAIDNTAVIRPLQYGNRLVAGTNLRTFTNLIWSDTHCYIHQYTGAFESVYTTLPIGANCGLVGPRAFAVDSSGQAYWMSNDTFFMSNGQSVEPIPNVLDIQEWLFARLHPQQRYKCAAVYQAETRQVRWFYVTEAEPEFYVDVSLEDFSWTVGEYQRNAMSHQEGVNAALYGVDRDGNIWLEWTGLDADGETMPWFIESAPIDIDDGNQLVDVQGYVPDFERHTGDILLTLQSWNYPQDTDVLETQQFDIAEGQGIVDCYFSGRQVSARLESVELGSDFRLGNHRIAIVDESQARR